MELLSIVLLVCVALLYQLSSVNAQGNCFLAPAGARYACTAVDRFILCASGSPVDNAPIPCANTIPNCVGGVTPNTAVNNNPDGNDVGICKVDTVAPAPAATVTCAVAGYSFAISGTGMTCQYYHRCNGVGDRPLIMGCPANEHFSVTLQACAPSATAGCSSQTAPTCDTDAKRMTLTADSTNCGRYEICNGANQKVSVPCPAGQLFDSDAAILSARICKTASLVTCGSRPNPGNNVGGGGGGGGNTATGTCATVGQYLQDSSSCRKYYTCTAASGTPPGPSKTCPFEYRFNTGTSRCDVAANVSCGTRPA